LTKVGFIRKFRPKRFHQIGPRFDSADLRCADDGHKFIFNLSYVMLLVAVQVPAYFVQQVDFFRMSIFVYF
jgi:hypothetical protein